MTEITTEEEIFIVIIGFVIVIGSLLLIMQIK